MLRTFLNIFSFQKFIKTFLFHMQSLLSYCYKKLFYIFHDVDTTLHSGIPYNFPLPSSLAYFDLHVLPLAALFEYIAI